MKFNNFHIFLLVFFISIFMSDSAVVVCQIFDDQPSFQYCVEPSYGKAVFLAFIVSIFSLFLSRKPAPSTVIMWIVFITHFVSTASAGPIISGYNLHGSLFVIFWTFVFVIFSRAATLVRIRIPDISISRSLFVLLVLCLFSAFFFVLFRNFGFTNIPSLYDVYGRRSEFKDTIQNSGSIFIGYIVLIGGFSLAPVIMLYSHKGFKKSYFIFSAVMFTLSILISVLIFSASGLKSVAFSSFVVLAFAILLNKKGEESNRFFTVFSVFLLFVFVISIFDRENVIFEHWFRRVFLIPGMVTGFYIDHIGIWNLNFLDNAPLVIDQMYFDSDGSANSGTIGSGLAMYGTLGVLINIIILFISCVVADCLTKKIDPYISMSAFVPAAYAFSNSAQTTVLLSYGFFSTALILYFSGNEFARYASRKRVATS